MFRRLVVCGLATGLASLGAIQDVKAEIGSVSAVNRDMQGTPPAQASRELTLGVQVFRDERVRTSDIGSGQIIFRDQTSLSIAPRSDMVLDSYVFDPDANTGEVSITLAKGALRFIGGRITKSRDAIIKTPTATIGIRGGMSIIQVANDGATKVIQIAGERTTVTGLGGNVVTLSRSSAKAEVSSDGNAEFTGLADSDELAPIVSSFEGGGDGGSEIGTNESGIDQGTASVAEGNSEESGGATRQPVSTQGEQQVEESEQESTPTTTDSDIASAIQDANSQVTGTAGDALVSAGILPTRGALLTLAGGVQPFTSIASGSLIGTTASGESVRLPIPESTADFDTTLFGEPVPNYFATSFYPDTGFNEVDFGDGTTLSGFTNAATFGFSDLGIGFHVYQIGEGPGGSDQEALALFGTPTPGQAAEFPGDGGTFDKFANTATFYRIEPDFELGSGANPNEGLFMLGNGSEPRFSDISAPRVANGGKFFNASIDIGVEPSTGEQFSNFSVLATPIGFSGGGPLLDGQIFGTDVIGTSRLISTTNVSTLADQDRNTVFGPDGRYLFAVAPLQTDAGGGFRFDSGEEHSLGEAGSGSSEPEPVMNLLTLDPTSQVVNATPLAFAQHAGSRRLGSTGQADGVLDGFHAAAISVCSDGECGQLGGSVPTGMYALRTNDTRGELGSISFESAFGATDTNDVAVIMQLEGIATEINTADDGAGFILAFDDARNGNSAYLDDAHFALGSSVSTNVGGEDTNADFLLASSGLTGDGGIFVGQNPQNFRTQPLNARWGWWSASFDVTSGTLSTPREDLIHLGSWVAGVRPDPADMPVSAIVGYGGVAIGTEADFNTLSTRVVGGDFELTYDFGLAQGNFRMNIAGLSINETAFGNPSESHAYQVNVTSPVQFQANGSFFSGAADPVAATGGDFQIDDFGQNRQIVGVFVGDRR